MRGTTTLAIALAAAAAVPATAAAERTRFSIAKASGVERVTFSSAPNCAAFRTCGQSGTVVHRFGGDPDGGSLLLRRDRRGRTRGAASFRSTGRTTSNVTSRDGETCQDVVRHTWQTFALGTRSRLSRLLFTLHPRAARRDYLATECAGPTETHLGRERALPQGSFPAKDFDNARVSFELKGETPFSDRGYRGTVRWDMSYAIVRRRR